MDLLEKIHHAFVSSSSTRELVDEFLHALECGTIRVIKRREDGSYRVDERIKEGILLAFRLGQKEKISVGPLTFIDKDTLWPRSFADHNAVRIVPGGASVRAGAFIGNNVTIMPPAFVNIGAFVDDDTLIDSNALVGSCAQIGKRVHVSAGVQIGGVLEPVGALPVIVEDDVLVGGCSGIFEGCIVGARAVIGAGVVLTGSSKVFDVVNEKIITAVRGVLTIPENAVLVPGTRPQGGEFAKNNSLSIATPLIIKYRDHHTDRKTALESALR